ncbi:MAG: protein tyrosine phosphatase [Bacteroidota bacterium]|nr:protein tyrosine phosphatase [Bacteroidota bacterium]
MNILFVCSKNKWRSRTAETIFKKDLRHHVKSAGTDEGAKIKLTENHLDWADVIFVMEYKHKQKIWDKFNSKFYSDKIIVLEIADDYNYMDTELIETLTISVSPYLDNVKK